MMLVGTKQAPSTPASHVPSVGAEEALEELDLGAKGQTRLHRCRPEPQGVRLRPPVPGPRRRPPAAPPLKERVAASAMKRRSPSGSMRQRRI